MRGQADAPVELVIGIIILVLSMALAFSVMQQTETGKCVATLKTETQQLQEAMMDVALGSSGTKRSVVFNMPRCGTMAVEGLRFARFDSPEYCRLCAGHYGGCWQIIPIYVTLENRERQYHQLTDAISCVDLPKENVEITAGSGCMDLEPSPCLSGDTNCKSGVPSSVTAHWQTLGSKDERISTYVLNLTKSVIAGAGGAESGQIQICAEKMH